MATCISPDAYYRSIPGNKFQNLYSLVYNATIAAATKSALLLNTAPAVWASSGTTGSQRYPVHWGGDSQCSWSGLQGSLRATLSMGLSGFSQPRHRPPYRQAGRRNVRVLGAGRALGANRSRMHGAEDDVGRPRGPWVFGEVAVDVFRKFADLRY